VIGGTNLLGGKGGGVEAGIDKLTKVLQNKQMTVMVDPLTGRTVYTQNIKGQIETNRRRVI
jgi:hypothetical protein